MSFYDALLFSKGQRGERGYSAYEIAVQNGYVGTEEEWANSFLSPTGYYNKNQVDLMMESVETDGEQRIESLLIGSENLIVNSGLSQNSDGFSLPQGITRDTEVKTPNNNNSFKYEITGLTQNAWRSFDVQPKIKINPGDELIFSVNVYIPSDVENSVIAVEFQVFDSNSTRLPVYPSKEVNQTITDQWQTISLTYEMPSQAMYVLPRVTVRRNGKCWVGDMKLVKGNKMTLWSPSSLDSKIYANNIVSNAMEKVNKKPYFFNNVAEMKTYNLSVGDIAITKGYYEPNDGGGGSYLIKNDNSLVQDGGIIHDLTNNLKAELILDEKNEINILQMGAKANATDDIGIIINKFTRKYNIFIPSGIYNISTNVVLYNSLRGIGYARSGNKSDKYTWINDNVNAQTALISVAQSTTSNIINISNIAIDCNNCQDAILYNPSQGYCYLNKIYIKNLSNIGIHVENSNANISRGCYIDTVCILGKAYASSLGILNSMGDSYFTNIEIMGVQKGIRSYADLRLSNAHIWCGSISGHDYNNWWKNTRGIECFSDAIINNLYLDTCYCAITSMIWESGTHPWTNQTIKIDGFKYWVDKSISESELHNGTIALTYPRDNNLQHYEGGVGNITITNAYMYMGGRISHIGTANFISPTIAINNIEDISDYYNLYGSQQIKYSLSYKNLEANSYNLIGVVQKPSNNYYGKCTFKWNTGYNGGENGELVIYENKSSNGSVLTNMNYYGKDTAELYYKTQGNFIYIYAKSTTSDVDYCITADNPGLLSSMAALDLSKIIIRDTENENYQFIRDTLNSNIGLTPIPKGKRLDNLWTFTEVQNNMISGIGDSISTITNNNTLAYYNFFEENCGFKSVNIDGVGGSTISTNRDNNFITRLENINQSSDVIYIFGGTNDWAHAYTLGTIEDTETTTFYGALKYISEYLLNNFYNKRLFFITPIQRNVNFWQADEQEPGSEINSLGLKLRDYVNAIIEVGKIYSIPVLNLYDNCISGTNNSVKQNLLPDGLHPNDAGHKIIARKICNFINYTL